MRVFLLLFFSLLSGMASLIYEVIWNRWLLLLFGSTTLSVSLILAVFMTGLAVGSLWMGRADRRISRPMMIYGLIEIGIGLYGALTPWIFTALRPVYGWISHPAGDSEPLLFLLRFSLVLVVLIIPTVLMGATLPLLARVFALMKVDPGSAASRLYGINTAGAVLGAGLSGFALLPYLGMQQSLMTAVAINLVIGLGALWIGATAEGADLYLLRPTFNPQKPVLQTAPARALLLAMFLSGLAAMVYEVAWTRELVLVLGSSTYAFSLILVAFLIGIAAGSLATVGWVDRLRQPLWVLAGLEAGIALLALLGQYGIGKLPEAYLYLYWLVGPYLPALGAGQLALSLGVMLGPTLLLGATFPLAVRMVNLSPADLGRSVASVYGVNTLGTVLGALTSGLVLIPLAGLQGTVMIGAAISLLASLVLISSDTLLRIPWRFALAGVEVGAIAMAVSIIPSWDPIWMSSGLYKEAPDYLNLVSIPAQVRKVVNRYRPLFYEEGTQATVSVVERPSFGVEPHLSLAIDGKVDASTGADMSTQVISGHLPLMLAERMDKVLVVGYASGVTVGSVLLYPVQELVAAEIEPAVIEASRFFNAYNHRPLEDPRLHLILDDGRHYLETASERFDVIISEPSNPWLSGPSRLFTREFFELSQQHLSPDGVMAQWIQMYGMSPDLLRTVLRTFHYVFAHVLVFQTAQADLVLLGSAQPLRLDLSRIKEAFSKPDIASDLGRIGIDSLWDLLARLRMGDHELPAFTGDGPLNTDDNGLLEFSAPKLLYEDTAEANQRLIQEVMRKEDTPFGLLAYLVPPEHEKIEMAQVAVRLGGQFLEEGLPLVAEHLAGASISLKATAEGHWLLGEVHDQQRSHLTALQQWEEALRLDPNHQGALLSSALYHQERENFEEAERFFQQAEQANAENDQLRFYHGINLYYLGSYFKARDHLDRFVKTSSLEYQAMLAHYYLLEAYGAIGQRQRAEYHKARVVQQLRELRVRLERDEGMEELDSLLQLVQVHSERAAFHDVERGLKVLVTRHLTDPLAHYYKGVSLYFLGHDQAAVNELRRVLEILPEGDDSSRARYYLDLIPAQTIHHALVGGEG